MKALFTLIFSVVASQAAFSQGVLRSNAAASDTVVIRCPIRAIPFFASTPALSEQPVPQNFYTQHLGFFCREELKLREVHVPVTFRLGSMDYCNWLEQKPGYR